VPNALWQHAKFDWKAIDDFAKAIKQKIPDPQNGRPRKLTRAILEDILHWFPQLATNGSGLHAIPMTTSAPRVVHRKPHGLRWKRHDLLLVIGAVAEAQ
jgi:hypothetical protein